ncbi:MAG: ABC transporter permease [Aequorivita sp.]|nr:ABC transporter permease [Aequorivita sp.]
MLRLLNIELFKLKHSRAVKVISVIYFLLILSISLIASIEIPFGQANFKFADLGIFNFPFIWHFNTYVAATLKILLAIVIVSLVSNEYSYRTLKQNLIDGLSKKEFIASKFMTILMFSIISTILVFIVTLVLGRIFSDYTEPSIIFSDLEYLLAYFVKLVAFFSFCLFLSVWVKRSAFALGFLFIWYLFEGFLFLILKFIFFRGTEIAEKVDDFFPLEAMANLIKEPGSRLGLIRSMANQLGENYTKDYDVTIVNIIIVLVWTALFVYWSYAILKKRDL